MVAKQKRQPELMINAVSPRPNQAATAVVAQITINSMARSDSGGTARSSVSTNKLKLARAMAMQSMRGVSLRMVLM